MFRRNIHDFQNAVTFLFEEIENKFGTLAKALVKAISVSNLKTFWQKVTSQWSKNEFFRKFPEMTSQWRHKWRHISIFLSLIERGDQYDSFDVLISSLRQLVRALGQIFSFFSYIRIIWRHQSNLVTPVTSFLVREIFFFLEWPRILTSFHLRSVSTKSNDK